MATRVIQQQEIKKSMGIETRRAISHVVLILLTILCLFWFYILIINCTRTNEEVTTSISFLPGNALAKNWDTLINGESAQPWFSGLGNTFLVAGLTALVCTYFSTMTAFAIHAYDFKFKNLAYAFILGIMMIPTQVTSLGFLDMCRALGWENTFVPLILPSMASPVTFFYLKQYMDSSLSVSLIEAARIDGSSEFKTFNKIVLPLMKPAIAVQAIFSFVTSWNNYFIPALLLSERDKMTLPILIARLRARAFDNIDYGEIYIGIAFSIFPVVFVYLLLSRSIVGGVALGGVKE